MTILIESYRDLNVWQAGIELAEDAYRLTAAFPAVERNGLSVQIRSSAASVPAKIAESYGCDRVVTCIEFLGLARGSLRQLETHVILAERLGFATTCAASPLLDRAREIATLIDALILAIEQSAGPQPVSRRPS